MRIILVQYDLDKYDEEEDMDFVGADKLMAFPSNDMDPYLKGAHV
jgi:hypothetical protein